jgi:uncharacterized protein YegL
VLLAVADPPSSLVARALAVQGYDVRPVPPADLGAALLSGAADDADVLALDAEAAEGLSSARQDTLLEAIDRGVGLFLVAGGDAGAWGRLRGTPLQRALALRPLPPPPPSPEPEPAPPPPPDAETPPVEPPEPEKGPGLRAERRPEEARPISLLLVLDRSGSMEGGKLTMAIEGAEKAAATLARTDRLGVLTFADDVTVDVPMTPVAEVRGTLGWTLAAVQAGGQTDIYGALERAGRILATEPSPIRHLLLLTDGRQTGYAVFMHLIRAMAAQGITLTAVGLGRDHDETLLKQLAMAAPHGRYIPADTEREVPTILTRDTERVADRRLREVEEMARIRDREHEGEPPPPEQEKPPPKPPEPATPEPEPAEPPETATPPAPEEEGPALAPLVAIRPHEATAGLPALPSVGPPRRAEPGPGAAVLLRRAEDEPVLGAARFGLGRVLVLALPDDAAGFAPWPGVERLLLQSVRAVRAPAGARTEGLDPRVLPSPGGEVLRIAAAPGASTAPIRVLWSGPEGERDLGLVTPGGETPLALPPLPPGRRATIQLVMDDGDGRRPAGPSVSYLARPRPAPLLRPGDADALARALGPAALDPSAPLFAPAPPQPIRRPLWPWPLVAALALLPLDVAFHRRAGKPA